MAFISNLINSQNLRNTVLTIGTFDGIHIGHRKLFQVLIDNSKALNSETVVVTFDPHPRHVLEKKGNHKDIISSIDEKIKLIKEIGIDHVVVLPFDINFSKLSAETFLDKIIIKYFHPKIIVVGHDHRFGFKKKGDIYFLKSKLNYYEYDVIEVKALHENNNIISSSLIRKLIAIGRVRKVNKLLGRNLSIKGKVVKGDGRGRTIGYPTANINLINKSTQIPNNGVFVVLTKINKTTYYGMCNIGFRPTFKSEKEKLIEVYLFNYNNLNLYEKELRIEFIQFVRKERKFDSKNKLINQIKKDELFCLKYLVEKGMIKKGDNFLNVNNN